MDRKAHWETVYETKSPKEVSWTQKIPEISLELIGQTGVSKTTSIIDVGGGDSLLIDFLLEDGYQTLSLLDISAKAIERAQLRLGVKGKLVNWIVSDIVQFKPQTSFEVWHDRAAFHFLTDPQEIQVYKALVIQSDVKDLIIGTFAVDGPLKCSGLDVKQYDAAAMEDLWRSHFDLVETKNHAHQTPFDTIQKFSFFRLKRK